MKGKLLKFMELIESIDECKISYIILEKFEGEDGYDSKSLNDAFDYLTTNRQYEMTLNTLVIPILPTPKLITYEQTGYCPLIPIPDKLPFSKVIFFKVNFFSSLNFQIRPFL
jgi:hypothetical protein